MQATVKKWGNSYALRLTKRDLERLGLKEGQPVVFEPRPIEGEKVDLSGLPVIRDPDALPFEEARRAYYRDLPKRWQE